MSSDAVRTALKRLASHESLTADETAAAFDLVMGGEATPAQIAALLMALRVKGETTEEIAGGARALRHAMVALPATDPATLIDTCGTGGGRVPTFNISTASALLAAGAGVRVAKHGNRSFTTSCGSADVLEALGLPLDRDPAASLDAHGIAFLFAPAFHGALKHAAPVRRELGLRTFFNLLGPLANPAGASHQLLGVYDEARVTQIAEVLLALGVTGAWVVHGAGGLDEVSPSGPTRVAVLRGGRVEARVIEPRDFGLEPVPLEALSGGGPSENASIARAVLGGERGAPRAAVVINAAAALAAAEEIDDLREAAERAGAAIDDGAAARLLSRWTGG